MNCFYRSLKLCAGEEISSSPRVSLHHQGARLYISICYGSGATELRRPILIALASQNSGDLFRDCRLRRSAFSAEDSVSDHDSAVSNDDAFCLVYALNRFPQAFNVPKFSECDFIEDSIGRTSHFHQIESLVQDPYLARLIYFSDNFPYRTEWPFFSPLITIRVILLLVILAHLNSDDIALLHGENARHTVKLTPFAEFEHHYVICL